MDSDKKLLQKIPGENGMPIVGHYFEALRNPLAFTEKMYHRYGPIFRFRMFLVDAIMLLGTEANEYLLTDKEQNFSSEVAWQKIANGFFKNSLAMRDFDRHDAHQQLIMQALREECLHSYINQMDIYIGEMINKWHAVTDFRFVIHTKQLIAEVLVMTLLGINDKKDITKIVNALYDISDGCIKIIRIPIPGFTYWRALKARRFLVDYLTALITNRRAIHTTTTPPHDLLSQLCVVVDEHNKGLSTNDIVDHLIFILIAAYETNIHLLTSAAYLLAKYSQWQQQLRAESKFMNSIPQISYDDLAKLKSYEMFFYETLRFYTPIQIPPRYALRDFEFQGYRIPGNTPVIVSFGFTHRMSAYWQNPNAFDPERFSEQRAEHKKNSFCYIPFGTGPHRCVGKMFTMMIGKIMIHRLLQQYDLSLSTNYVLQFGKTALIPLPKDGLPLKLSRTKNS